jgi:hypothetical protein
MLPLAVADCEASAEAVDEAEPESAADILRRY